MRLRQFAVVLSIATFLSQFNYAGDTLPSDLEAERLGLEVQWRSQSQRSLVGTGMTGMELWPSKAKREYIIVRVGSRVIETIDAQQVDRVALEKQILSDSGESKLPKLGLEAARAKAALIVERFKRLGRTATIEEIIQPINYLITASRDGAVQGFDADNGQLLWTTAVGNASLPTYGPGVNDDYVAISNGNNLYVLQTATGKLVGSKRLSEGVAAAPQPILNMIYCSTLGGDVVGIDAENLDQIYTTSVRFSNGIASPVVYSSNRLFVAWPNNKSMYVAQTGLQLKLWSALRSKDAFVASPQATRDGFVAVSSGGMVYRINLNRTEALLWRHNLSAQTETTPLVADGLVLVTTDAGNLAAIDLNDGNRLWVAEESDIAMPLAVTPTRVFAQLIAGQLVAIDRATGKTFARVEKPFGKGLHNSVNDRLILSTDSGSIVCMHEIGSENAKNYLEMQEKVAEGTKKNKQSASDKSNDSESDTSSADPFADPATPGAKNASEVDDPFGGTPDATTTTDDDPFGM